MSLVVRLDLASRLGGLGGLSGHLPFHFVLEMSVSADGPGSGGRPHRDPDGRNDSRHGSAASNRNRDRR
ncbi:hypothetical protein CDD83_5591 [Cordyceps sp. RAO-2017]|nr:hypothetical protein CDD83_5591 [Cordyceps sp. RAO-2017]